MKDEHYPVVGQALIETLANCLGQAFTDEAREAWATAYGVLTERMITSSKSMPGLAA